MGKFSSLFGPTRQRNIELAIANELIVRPVIGGFFAKPVPDLLPESWTFFVDFPYFLPALVTSMLSLVAIGVAAVYIPEVRYSGSHFTASVRGIMLS